MENTTDTRSEIEKLYDKAYQQGFIHATQLFEMYIEMKEPRIPIEKFKTLITDKTHTP